jgi:hypothetical protein
MLFFFQELIFNIGQLLRILLGFASTEINYKFISLNYKLFNYSEGNKVINFCIKILNDSIKKKKIKDLKSIKNKILKKISYLPNFSPQNFFYLYRHLLIFGEFEAACVLRKKFINNYQKGYKPIFFETYFSRKITKLILFEKNKKKLLEIITKKSQGKKSESLLNSFLLEILNKNNHVNEHKVTTVNNILFSKLIKNKRIALVAKSPGNENIIINKFDLIVRIGSIMKNNHDPLTDKKTDIVYFNHASFDIKNIKKIIKKYKMIFVKEYSSKNFCNYCEKLQWVPDVDFNYFGTLNMLLVSLIDLIIKKPKNITIFNASLFLPIKNKVYSKIFKNKKSYASFYIHDPFLQFNLLKFLINSAKINVVADKNLKSIINFSEYTYSKLLDKTYSKSQKIYVQNYLKKK